MGKRAWGRKGEGQCMFVNVWGASVGVVSLFVFKCKNQRCKFYVKLYSSSKIKGR